MWELVAGAAVSVCVRARNGAGTGQFRITVLPGPPAKDQRPMCPGAHDVSSQVKQNTLLAESWHLGFDGVA